MLTRISVAEFLQKSQNHPIIDVRSPGEFLQGHIPNANNLPMFSNEERAIVGTLYKQQGKRMALLKGLDFVGLKMSNFVKSAEKLTSDGTIFIHCWRGGMRSESVATLLAYAGFKVFLLTGGYKAFRQYCLEFFERKEYELRILGGKTGAGKTEILHHLKEMNEQIIDLEGIANHRGSAFGNVMLPPQPSSEQFENELFHALSLFDLARPIWTESESRTIGKVFIPKGFWEKMEIAPFYSIETPLEIRVERLIAEYAEAEPEELTLCLDKILRKLGGLRHQQAQEAFIGGDLKTATAILLSYYDTQYEFSMSNRKPIERKEIKVEENDMKAVAKKLLQI